MKVKHLCLLVLCLALSGICMAQEINFEMPSTKNPPVIDGVKDALYNRSPTQYIIKVYSGSQPPQFASGAWNTLWDEEYLYFFVDVNDDTLFNDTGQTWQDDSIEFYIDGDNSKEPAPKTGDSRQITMGWGDTDFNGGSNLGDMSDSEYTTVTTDTGYALEARFHWPNITDVVPTVGTIMGIECMINDDDNGGTTREEKLGTYADTEAWDDASLWGNVRLVTGTITTAQVISPEDGAKDVPRDTMLSWLAGDFAVKHELYLGTDELDVGDATLADPMGGMAVGDLTDTSYDPGILDFGKTYYWRVDEVNAPSAPFTYKGDVWSFTTELFAYPVTPITATGSSSFMPAMSAERTIDGSGLDAEDLHGTSGNDMWLTGPTDTERTIQYEFDKPQKLHEMLVWNSNQAVEGFVGFGAKTVKIETSLDGTTWTELADVPEFKQAPGAAGYAHNTVVPFGGVTAKHVKLTVLEGWGSFTTQYGLSEVRFLAVPVYPSNPNPANGATVGSIDVTLGWRRGREADTSEVSLSTDQAAVEAGTAVVGTETSGSYTPASLLYGTEYFWCINEMNAVAETASYKGDVWSFLAPEYLVIDDMESYADAEFEEIWATWVDGYQNDDNGSVVGNGNTGDTDVYYEGGQSMPIHFDNSGAAISEVTRTFSPPLDWNIGAPTTLSLQIRGDAPAFVDGGDTLTIGGSGADIWNTADEFRFVYKNLSGDGSITAKVESLTHVHPWAKAGVMIRESLSAESSCAYTCATGEEGVTFQYRRAAFTNAESDSSTRDASWADQDDEPVWVRVERIGDEFNGYISLDGVDWSPSVSNPQTIQMLADVKIGFCVTSHDNNQSSTAVYSNVSTTGSVSGNWTVQEFGTGHPDNDAAPMYLVVADSNGREKMFTHPDANATINTLWTPWQIPLSDLGSVNLGSIETLTIGVGTPGGSATGDQGTVYVDLIQVGTPR